ncbi:MAG: hypothetical protein C4584_00055 [Armatimonadetes bacterium]|nr:MAG: hypothetical protein C4584_00055 [Armatimonadota bacterium]
MKKLLTWYQHFDKFVFWPITITISSLVFIVSFFAYFYTALPAKIPLFYSLPWGEAQLVDKNDFYIIPLVVLLISITNIVISFYLHPLHYILKRLLLSSLVIINFIVLVTVLKIILIFI